MIITLLWVISSLNSCLKAFVDRHNLYNVIKSNTCLKGKGSCFDLFQTYFFKFSGSYETGITDYHHIIYTMLKSCFNVKL